MKKRINIGLTIFCLLFVTVRTERKNFGKVIINTDAGGDDAFAILLALKYEASPAGVDSGFKIIAITCSYGNTYEENVEKNVLKILTVANRSDIPVFAGATRPLLQDPHIDNFFGSDGFGDFQFNQTITATVNRLHYGAVVLIDLVKRYPDVSILNLGPSTNLALAFGLDSSFPKHVRRFYIMGGSVAGIGNMSPGVEYNFGMDPAANYMVLNHTKQDQILLFPLETAHKNFFSKEWRESVFGQLNTTSVKFLNNVERVALQNSDTYVSVDVIATAVMIWPELITKSLLTNVSPVTNGEGRGTILVDYKNVTNKIKNANVVLEFNGSAYKEILLKYFQTDDN